MKPADLTTLLQELYRERLALRMRHVKGAESVSDYEFNNTYQYIVAREDAHLGWLRRAILDDGGEVPTTHVEMTVPRAGKGSDAQRAIFEDDARSAQAFVDRWQPRLDGFTNARHKGMVRIILGETLEHKRFFTQALNGRLDLLGRRAPGASTGGGVMSTRWVE
ncbi:MAG: hypothetical protein U0Q12_09285 [Vicinamibacterales bacterium]